jgi:capsular polysaccharide transport system permease protein
MIVENNPGEAVRRQARVVLAIMLRNMQTRFFGHGLGFALAVAWPVAHILILLLINASMDRAAPYGNSLAVFFATGLVPFMTFSYMSRYVMISTIQNRPLLAFPEVKIVDLLVGGALLEVVCAWCMTVSVMVILACFGIDVLPRDPVQAAYALGASMLLGFGFGIINAAIAMAVPTWITGYTLLTVFLYIVSGIFFLPNNLPETARYYLSFNPALQVVEWMRSAYYEGYGATTLDKPYTIGLGVVVLCLGLLIERAFRGRLLMTK